MLIKNIESKVKIGLWAAIISVIGSICIAIASFYFAYAQIAQERKQIYVLDAGVPLLLQQTTEETNRDVEYESHINLFHNMFFTLPPDDKFIKKNIEKSMYMVDQTGLMEYSNLQERGYYNRILSSSAVLTIQTDSVHMNYEKKSFEFFGTQRIDRTSNITFRKLHTSGSYRDVPRTRNNPHGVLITDWRTLSNRDYKIR